MTLLSFVSLSALLLQPFGKLVTPAASYQAQWVVLVAAWLCASDSSASLATMKREAGKWFALRVFAAAIAPW